MEKYKFGFEPDEGAAFLSNITFEYILEKCIRVLPSQVDCFIYLFFSYSLVYR